MRVFPIYHQPEIQHVIINAVKWAAPIQFPKTTYGNPEPIVPVTTKAEGITGNPGLHQPK